jgi:hypothetical protein
MALAHDVPAPTDLAMPACGVGERASSWDEWFTPWRFAGLLLLAICAAFPDVVTGTHTFFYRDYGCFGYPLAHHHREAFWRGEIPFWNPLNNCGIPHLAQWNTMVFYPLSFIYLLLPMPWALGFFSLGHLFLTGLGMYFLAHRWTGNRLAASVAGFGFALNGLTLHALMWPNNIAALAWMPFVVLLTERGVREGGRALVLAALTGAVQMLTGAPEIILFTWMLASAFCLTMRETPWRTRFIRFALAGLVVAALAAAQLLPFLDLTMNSQRDRNFATNAWSMPAWGWANLLVPLFHCSPSVVGVYSQDAQQWTSSYYAGIGVTALALLGALRWRERRGLVLGVAVAVSLMLALGNAGGLYPVLKKVLPVFGLVRFPIKFVVVTIFALPLLTAFAVARWQAASDEERALEGRRWMRICAAVVALVVLIVALARCFPAQNERWQTTLQSGASRAILLCAVALLLFSLRKVSGARGLWLRLGFVAVFALDTLTHAPRQNPTVHVDAYGAGAVKRTWAASDGARAMISPRMQSFMDYAATADTWEFCLGQRRSLFPNWNLVENIPTAGGFYSLYTAAQNDVRSLWTGSSNTPVALADFSGVRWISSDAELFAWQERKSALPLVTSGQRPVFANRQETLHALASSTFNPAQEVLLPLELTARMTATNSVIARVLTNHWGAGSLEVEVETASPTLLTIAQTAAPGWSATVNGQPARLLPANHAFQAVEIPAGRSEVRLIYRERTFGFGVAISLLALLGCAFVWWRKQRTPQTEFASTVPT